MTSSNQLPVFGKLPSGPNLENDFLSLQLEMLRCTRVAPKDSDTNTVNILHMSADINSAKLELQMIVDFMKSAGFCVKRESGMMGVLSTDVVILGIDKEWLASLGGIFDTFVYGIGLLQGWDVLLYGTSGTITTELKGSERPWCSNSSFGSLGICMLQTHLKMRDDRQFWIGFFTYMAIEVETFLDHILGTTNSHLYDKMTDMKHMLENDGLYGPDAQLFYAAANVLRKSRNIFVHSQRNVQAAERKKQAEKADDFLQTFYETAKSYGRTDILKCRNISNMDIHSRIKELTRIALWTRRWIYDLYKTR